MDAVLALELNRLFDEGKLWDEKQGRSFLRNSDNVFLVARWDGVIRGFLTAHRLQRIDARRAEVLLDEIGVAEEFRRRGIASALIEAVKRWAWAAGAVEMWVLTDRSNTAAMALYESTGGNEDSAETATFTYRVPAVGD